MAPAGRRLSSLAQIPCHALLDLSEAALHLRAREFLSRLLTALNLYESLKS